MGIMDKKEVWKNRPIRMPDDLWYQIMIEAGKQKVDMAEWVRLACKEKLTN